MKIKVEQKELTKGINIVQKGISSKTTLPILSGILIETKENKLKLTATDLEIGIESNINCEVFEQGSIVITSRVFGDMIRKLPDMPVELEVKENNIINVKCGNSNFDIVGQPAVEYPKLPKILDDVSFNIPKDLLKTMIRQTVFATAQDETRPILTGALLEVKNNEAALVALDGYRLALKKVNIQCDNEIKVVIPSKTLNELSKILDDSDSDINIRFTSSHVLFDLGDTVIISRLIEGQFLNYVDIIRNEYTSKARVNTKNMHQSIERASLLAREGKNNLIKLDISDDNLIIASNSEIGNIHEKLSIDLEGNDLRIAFNSKYILEGIKVIDSEEIEMNFISNVSPCIIKPIGDENYTYLILPVRLANED